MAEEAQWVSMRLPLTDQPLNMHMSLYVEPKKPEVSVTSGSLPLINAQTVAAPARKVEGGRKVSENKLPVQGCEEGKKKGLVDNGGRKKKEPEKFPGDGEECCGRPVGEKGKRCEEAKMRGPAEKVKDKIPGQQQKLPGDGKQCCRQPGGEEGKKPGVVDQIKDKIPAQQQKLPGDGKQCYRQPGGEKEKEVKKRGPADQIKDKIPAQQQKLPGDGKQCCRRQPGGKKEKKPGMVDKIKEKLPGHQNKNDVE